jgi:hypothetical protein
VESYQFSLCQNKNPIILASLKEVQKFNSTLFLSNLIKDKEKVDMIFLAFAIFSKEIVKEEGLRT